MACERLARLRIRAVRDQGEPAYPHEPGRHDIVLLAEVAPRAGDHPIAAGGEILRHRDIVRPLLVIVRRRQFGLEGLGRRSREQLRPLGIVEPADMRSPREHSFEPVGLHDPQVHVREIAVAHANHRPGPGPRPLDEHRQRFRLDLGDQVFTEFSAGALRVLRNGLGSDRAGLDQVIFLAHERREMVAGQRRRLVVVGLRDEGFECLPLAVGEFISHGMAGCPEDPVEVGGEQRRAIGVVLVKLEQVAIEAGRLEERRVAIGHGRIFRGPPGEKFSQRAERRPVGRQFEGVFRIDKAALTRFGEGQAVADDQVPDRRPVGIGHRARLQNHVPLGDRQFLERSFRRKRCRESRTDLADDLRKIPGGDRSQIAIRRAAARPLGKPPAVVHEEAPRPVRADRLEHTPRLRRRLLHGGRQEEQPFGIIGRPVAGLRDHPGSDRADGFRPGFLRHGRLLDAGERLGRRLWFALCQRRLDPLPRRRPRACRSIVAADVFQCHAGASEKKTCQDKKHSGGAGPGPRPLYDADASDTHGRALRNPGCSLRQKSTGQGQFRDTHCPTGRRMP